MAELLTALPEVHHVTTLNMKKGWRLPEHVHAATNELILILDGEIETNIHGQILRGTPGSILVYPHGVPHRERSIGGPLRMLYVVWREAAGTPFPAGWPYLSNDGCGRMNTLLQWLHELFPGQNPAEKLTACSLLHCALHEFALSALRASQADPITSVCHYIKRNFAKENLQLDDLAKIAHQSKYHFARHFQKTTGETPMRYLRRTRVEAARTLLATTPMPLRAIAPLVGLADEFHLSRVFQTVTGRRPSEIRKQDTPPPNHPVL